MTLKLDVAGRLKALSNAARRLATLDKAQDIGAPVLPSQSTARSAAPLMRAPAGPTSPRGALRAAEAAEADLPRFRLRIASSGVSRTAGRQARHRLPAWPKDVRAAAQARTASVFASQHSQGRERQAADMLATRMSPSEIIGLLAKSPKGAAAADPMLAHLTAQHNPDLGAGIGDETGACRRAAIGATWARARDFVRTGRRS